MLDISKYKSDICTATGTLFKFDDADIPYIDELLDNIKEIYDNAFKNSAIMSIFIPSNIIQIGGNVFDNCYNLEEIHFSPHSSIRCLMDGFAKYCPNLKVVVLPPMIKFATSSEIKNCGNLKQIVTYGTELRTFSKTGSHLEAPIKLIDCPKCKMNDVDNEIRKQMHAKYDAKAKSTIVRDDELTYYSESKGQSPVAENISKQMQARYSQGEPRLIEKLMAELGVLSQNAKTEGNEDKSKEYSEYVEYLKSLDSVLNK